MWENKCDLKSSSDKERKDLVTNIANNYVNKKTLLCPIFINPDAGI